MKGKKTIGITGASGALGKCLTRLFKSKGYKVIGFTHKQNRQKIEEDGPNEWIIWECGKENLLKEKLENIDLLILNHGFYEKNNTDLIENSLEINALSKFRIFRLFEQISLARENLDQPNEIWINTSEAELLPALNPSYEISKSLIGQFITYKRNFINNEQSNKLKIRKIILGPFKSELNPIGIMPPSLVANLIYLFSKTNFFLIIVSPNPITYLIFTIKEFYFSLYYFLLKKLKINN